jgi:hypothetical protein
MLAFRFFPTMASCGSWWMVTPYVLVILLSYLLCWVGRAPSYLEKLYDKNSIINKSFPPHSFVTKCLVCRSCKCRPFFGRYDTAPNRVWRAAPTHEPRDRWHPSLPALTCRRFLAPKAFLQTTKETVLWRHGTERQIRLGVARSPPDLRVSVVSCFEG